MKKLTVLILVLFILTLTLNGEIKAQIRVGDIPQDVDDIFRENIQDIEVESWIEGLNVPWDLVFLPGSERALVTERSGKIRLIENGVLQSEPYVEFDLSSVGEGGLMGLTYHHDFPEEPYIYIMYTYSDVDGDVYNRVSRLEDKGREGVNEEVIIEDIPGGRYHDGGRIAFGPDDMLFITTGDSGHRNLAQDKDSLAGKILRLTPEGEIPEDNPFAESPVYSLGHRNPQGLAWHPETGDLFISDHGPSGEDGLHGKDRIKVIEPGKNYGWPEKVGYFEEGRFSNPLIMWDSAVPPSGITFYHGDLFVATLRSEALIRIVLESDGDYDYKVNRIERWFASEDYQGKYGRIRTAVVGPDDYLYILTSNRDGRGNPRSGDDRVLRFKLKK
ncbi:MAG: PQQ-dependent sugar dehydrogenase [Halanaerobiaceae bacterium]